MPNTTLPTMLRAEALAEIMAYQTQLFERITGELPPGEALDVIVKSADSWINELVLLLIPHYELMPEFQEIENKDVKEVLSDTWLKAWYNTYILRAQLFGLSEKTAKAVVDHLHSRTT